MDRSRMGSAANSRDDLVSQRLNLSKGEGSSAAGGGYRDRSRMGSAANSRDDLSSQKFNFNKSEAQHFWSEAEAVSYVHWINERLEGDSLVGSKIPIPPNGAALFAALWDGLLLARLVQLARPESIDWEKFDPAPRLQIQAAENIRHALEGAARTGVRIHNVGPDDIIKRTPHLCLGLIWQIIKIGLLSNVAIGTNFVSDSHEDLPGVLRRARMATGDSEGRPPPANATSAAERALLGWLNAAAAATGCPVTARNFGADLADGVVLAHAVEFVDGGRNGTEARALLGAADGGEAPEERRARAERVLEAAGRIGCRHFATADDIAAGRREPNLALVAVLHNAHAAAAADGLAAARQQVRDAQAEQAQATARREKARAEELERRLREAAQEASGVDQEREDAGRRARRAEEEAAVERRRAEDATRATAAAVQERDGAVRRLDELAAGRAELEQRVQELTVQAAAAGELLRLSEERTAVERERGRAEAARDAEELGIERDVAARRAEDAEERLARTMAKLESLAMVEAQLAAAQRQLEDRESFLSGELSATREQLRAAQTELSQVTDDARGRATAREEGSRRLAQAEARVVALTEELDEVRGELGGRADRADERAEQTRQELAAMRDQLRDAEIRAAEVQRLERVAKFEIQEVQERAGEKAAELKRALQERLEAEAAVASVRGQLRSMEEANVELREQLATSDGRLEASEARVRSLQQNGSEAVAAAEAARVEAIVRADRAEAQAAAADSEKRTADEREAELHQALKELKNRFRELEEERDAAVNRAEQAENTVQRELRELQSAAAVTGSRREEEVASVRDQLSRARDALHNLSTELGTSEASRDRLKAECELKEAELAAMHAQAQELQTILAEKTEEEVNIARKVFKFEEERREVYWNLELAREETESLMSDLQSYIERKTQSRSPRASVFGKSQQAKVAEAQSHCLERIVDYYKVMLDERDARLAKAAEDLQQLGEDLHAVREESRYQRERANGLTSFSNEEIPRLLAAVDTYKTELQNAERPSEFSATSTEHRDSHVDSPAKMELIKVKEALTAAEAELQPLKLADQQRTDEIAEAVKRLLVVEGAIDAHVRSLEYAQQQQENDIKRLADNADGKKPSVAGKGAAAVGSSVETLDGEFEAEVWQTAVSAPRVLTVAAAGVSVEAEMVVLQRLAAFQAENYELFERLGVGEQKGEAVGGVMDCLKRLGEREKSAEKRIEELVLSVDTLNDELQQAQEECQQSRQALQAAADAGTTGREADIGASAAALDAAEAVRLREENELLRARLEAAGEQQQPREDGGFLVDWRDVPSADVLDFLRDENERMRVRLELVERVGVGLVRQRVSLFQRFQRQRRLRRQQRDELERQRRDAAAPGVAVRALVSLDNLRMVAGAQEAAAAAAAGGAGAGTLAARVEVLEKVASSLVEQRSALIRQTNDARCENEALREKLMELQQE